MVINMGLLSCWVLLNIVHFFPPLDCNEMSWFRHRFHQLSKLKQAYVCESWLAGEDPRRGGEGQGGGGGDGGSWGTCGTQEKQTELHCHS